MATFDGDNEVAYYNLDVSEICPDKIKGVACIWFGLALVRGGF